MFFKAHPEGRIGYKQISEAELGQKSSSHQTHIGLFDDILTFLQNQEVEERAMFIYNNTCDIVDCYFDRIENPDGTFRSPKIRAGDRNAISVFTIIRNLAKEEPDRKWYLIWFGLESEEVVFCLFNDQSEDYKFFSQQIKLNLGSKQPKGRIDRTDYQFNTLISYLEGIVNDRGAELVSELEVASQTGSTNKFRPFDVEKANELFKQTGKDGESLIAAYLHGMKEQGQIVSYTWMNQEGESGLPYDFIIQLKNQNLVHADVKATAYKFEQPMVFSSQEISFINTTPYYTIFRVYGLGDEQRHMRICETCKNYIPMLDRSITEFGQVLKSQKAELQSVKLAVPPTISELIFQPEVSLS